MKFKTPIFPALIRLYLLPSLLLAGICFGPAWAQEEEPPAPEPSFSSGTESARLGGFFNSNLGIQTYFDNSRENIVEFRNGFFLKGDFDPRTNLHWTLSGRFSYKASSTEEGDFSYYYQPELFEAYANLNLGKLDLKLGQQVARWGRADLSPTDNLNPADLRDFIFTEPEFAKLPILMARAKYFLGDFNIEGIYIPFYEPIRMPPAGDNWFIMTPRMINAYIQRYPEQTFAGVQDTLIQVDNTDYPKFSPQNGEAGLRVSGTRAGFDFSVDYLYAWQDFFLPHFNPDFIQYARENMARCRAGNRNCQNGEEILLDLTPQELLFYSPLYHLGTNRTHILGADFSTNFRSFGIRAEAAFQEKISLLNEDFSLTRKPFLQFSAGADRLFNGRHYLNFQVMESLILNWGQKTINPVNGAPINIFIIKRSIPSLVFFFRTSFGEEEEFQPEFRASYNPTFGDYLINVLFNYSWSDSIKLVAGVVFLSGPSKSIFGNYSQNDSAYLGFRYSF
ncbi:MAG: hypothetical protein NT009_05825 [Proteobacteria bacterium]|nr:hypothetical protein [Pseudomonadota bacterium]